MAGGGQLRGLTLWRADSLSSPGLSILRMVQISSRNTWHQTLEFPLVTLTKNIYHNTEDFLIAVHGYIPGACVEILITEYKT